MTVVSGPRKRDMRAQPIFHLSLSIFSSEGGDRGRPSVNERSVLHRP